MSDSEADSIPVERPGWGRKVRIDWGQTVLDATLRCADCGHVTHLHGVFPDLLLQCALCGSWYPAYDCQWIADGAYGISSSWSLREYARAEWMLALAIQDRLAEPEGDDYDIHLRRRCEAHFTEAGRLCEHLKPKGDCRLCRVQESLRETNGEAARLASDRGCVTCPWRTGIHDVSEAWLAERRARFEASARAAAAESRAEQADTRVAALEAELEQLKAATLGAPGASA
jgi:hypothetical protein